MIRARDAEEAEIVEELARAEREREAEAARRREAYEASKRDRKDSDESIDPSE